jgi:hypothetical protein
MHLSSLNLTKRLAGIIERNAIAVWVFEKVAYNIESI